MLATMPAVSFTMVWALAETAPSITANPSINNRFILASLLQKRPNFRHPIGAGNGVEVRSFHTTQFNRMIVCSGHASVLLKSQDMKTLRLERQGHQHIHLLRASNELRRNLAG